MHYHQYRYSPRRSWTPWGFSESLQGGVQIRKPLYALAPVVLASATRAARTLLAAGGFDVVHVHWVVPNGPIGALVAPARRIPLVISLHGSDVAVSERSRAIGRATRWSFTRAAAVTAPSDDLLQRAARLGATGILECVPYGADVRAFEVAADAAEAMRRRLGFGKEHIVVAGVGRLVAVKGFQYLVDAHAEALASVPQLRLVLVGDGDLRGELEARVRTLGVADSVVLAGAADRSEIPCTWPRPTSSRCRRFASADTSTACRTSRSRRWLRASRSSRPTSAGCPSSCATARTASSSPRRTRVRSPRRWSTLARDAGLRERLGANARGGDQGRAELGDGRRTFRGHLRERRRATSLARTPADRRRVRRSLPTG